MITMTAAQSPVEIYKAALEERKSDDPLQRREACEKGFLAAVEAVDDFLVMKGYHIPKGESTAHLERADALNELADCDATWQKIRDDFFIVQTSLHGICFYGGKNIDSPAYDHDLNVTVSEILELTGFHFDSVGDEL